MAAAGITKAATGGGSGITKPLAAGMGAGGKGDSWRRPPQLEQQSCRPLSPELRAVGGSGSNSSSGNDTAATSPADTSLETESSRGEAFCSRGYDSNWSLHLQLWLEWTSPRQQMAGATAPRSHLRQEWEMWGRTESRGGKQQQQQQIRQCHSSSSRRAAMAGADTTEATAGRG